MRAWRLAALLALMRSARIVMVHAVLEVSSFVRQLAQRATRQCCVGHARAHNIREVAAPAAHGDKRQAGQIAVFVGLQQDMQRLAHVGATGRLWEQTVRHQAAFVLWFWWGRNVSLRYWAGLQICRRFMLIRANIEIRQLRARPVAGPALRQTGPISRQCCALVFRRTQQAQR